MSIVKTRQSTGGGFVAVAETGRKYIRLTSIRADGSVRTILVHTELAYELADLLVGVAERPEGRT